MTPDDVVAANTIAAGAFAGPRFAFDFGGDDQESGAPGPLPVKRSRRPGADDRPGHIPRGLLAQTVAGEYVHVDWDRSSAAAVYASGRFHAPVDLQLLDEPVGVYDADLWLVDAVFDARLASFGPGRDLLHYAATPLSFEPGLAPLCWPLHGAAFRRHVYNRRAWVVHAGRHRLHGLSDELARFDVDALIAGATRTVAWLRDGDALQYVDVETGVLARALYRAGHSLYFNPDLDLQRRFVEALAADLGMDFAAGAGGDFGGDVEMFAVRGPHRTPWHYDAQHNFTIQLSGTKRWSIKRGAIRDPISNLHPRSTNRDAVRDDVHVHGATAPGPMPDVPDDDDEGVFTFTLRPGSTLYLPAGWWHRVEQVDAETPSLSMNVSLDGSRWADLVLNRLQPLLWASPDWRARPDFSDGLDSARAQLQTMLDALSRTIAQLKAEDVLSEGLLLGSRPKSSNVRLGQLDRADVDLAQSYRRSPLVYLVEMPPDAAADDDVAFSIVSGFGKFADGVKPEFCLTIRVPESLRAAARRLIGAPNEVVVPIELAADLDRDRLEHFQHFVDVLVRHGYFIAIQPANLSQQP